MEYEEFKYAYVDAYKFNTDHRYRDNQGYIVWRLGTGENIELLHIRTFKKGKGYGRKLFYNMLEALIHKPPYYSVFGFTRVSNKEAQAFYGELGFELQEVNGVYKDGKAILFHQSFETLLEKKKEYEA